MTSKTVTVQYVNQPEKGRKTGSIKTTDGEYWQVWPDKLHNYFPGAVIRIDDFDSYEAQSGKIYNTITKAALVGGERKRGSSSNGAAQSAGGPPYYSAGESPEKQRFIYVCAVVGRAMGNPGVNPFDITEAHIAKLTRAAISAFEATLGPNAKAIQTSTGPAKQPTEPGQPFDEEVGDQIPF